MFGIGMPEMLVILAIALIVIGPKKLPDLAKSLGRAIGEFKKAASELKDSMDIENDMKSVKDTFKEVETDMKAGQPPAPSPKAQPPALKPVSEETAANPAENKELSPKDDDRG